MVRKSQINSCKLIAVYEYTVKKTTTTPPSNLQYDAFSSGCQNCIIKFISPYEYGFYQIYVMRINTV